MAKSLPAYTNDQDFVFSYLRMGQSGYNAPGIVISGDMAVSPGSGLQVSIAAGEAYVQQTVARLGSFYASRGVYYIFDDSIDSPYNTITAPVTYPRVDQVIARVYDAYEQQLTGNSYWRYEWVMGTETSGATLTNLDGAAALPDNSLRLAYGLATTGMSSWSSDNILNVASLASGRGIANGVATLDSTGNVPADELGNILTCTITQPTLAPNTARTPNATRPTFVSIYGNGIGTILVTDDGDTVVEQATASGSGAASFIVPADKSYTYAASGAATVTEWTL